MQFLHEISRIAKSDLKTIVLPESNDIRTLNAVSMIQQQGLAKIILVGNPNEIQALSSNLDLGDTQILDPESSVHSAYFSERLYTLRQSKGISLEEAKAKMKHPLYFGVMLVKEGLADGMVAGAIHSTGDTLRPALQILKTAPGTKIVSSFFVMEVPNCELGYHGKFVFADCALIENPTAEELSDIAIASANSFRTLLKAEPKVAMLSYSTYGSANSPQVQKIIEATKLAKDKAPHIHIDGELQLDAALIPAIGKFKAVGSPVAGSANVLVFPDLNAGNIGYKLTQRLAKAEAFGPITQGLAKPVNDLSRGCSAEDIVGVVAITAVQAQMQSCKF